MEVSEIDQSNLMIAQFMGDKEYIHKTHFSDWMREEAELIGVEDLRFHESWDWLMPVIQKISNLYEVFTKGFAKYLPINHDLVAHNGIEPVYKKVVEFLQWHINEQQ
jgi:hypothetical protein